MIDFYVYKIEKEKNYLLIEKAPGLRTQLIKEHLASVGTQLSPDELNIVLSSLDIIHNLLFVEPHPVDYKNDEDQPNDNAENDLRALDAFTRLCLHENSQIKSSVCRSLHDLAANSEVAKETASQNNDLIQTLVNHLSDDDKTVRVTACQALMSICITTKGKLTAVSMGVVEKLISLLDESIACSVPEKLSRVEEFEASLNDSLRLYKKNSKKKFSYFHKN